MTVKLFIDLLSQPSRALYIFCKLTNINFQTCMVNLGKGEHMTDEYKEKVSRFGKVPVLHDGDFKLAESVAILRYLSRQNNVPDHWYPKDSKRQAAVDEYLEWQHNNTRAFCALYFQVKWLRPMLTGKQPTEEKLSGYLSRMENCLNEIETLWLSRGPYIVGDKISVADLLASCEIEQTRIAGYDARKGRPILSAWMDRVRKETNPFYDEAHTILNKLADKSSKQAAKL